MLTLNYDVSTLNPINLLRSRPIGSVQVVQLLMPSKVGSSSLNIVNLNPRNPPYSSIQNSISLTSLVSSKVSNSFVFCVLPKI